MTLDEAAAYLGVAKITLRRWTQQGHLPCVRIGKRGDRRFRQADLDRYIDGLSLPRSTKPAKGPLATKIERSSTRRKR